MRIGEIEARPDNSLILMYEENDLMDGIYIDMGKTYGFISAHTPRYDDIADTLESEGVQVLDVMSYTPNSPPHCYVIDSLARLVVAEAESLL